MSCPFYHSKNYMSTYIPGIFPGVYLGSAHESSTEKTGSYCSLSKWDDPLGLDQLGVDESHSFFFGLWIQQVLEITCFLNLVGGFNPSEYESVSWDDEIPNMMGKSFKIPWFQSPPTSHSYSITRGLITIKSPLNHQQPTRVYWSHKSGALASPRSDLKLNGPETYAAGFQGGALVYDSQVGAMNLVNQGWLVTQSFTISYSFGCGCCSSYCA